MGEKKKKKKKNLFQKSKKKKKKKRLSALGGHGPKNAKNGDLYIILAAYNILI